MIKTVALVEFCPPRLGSDRRIYELLTRLPSDYKVNFIVLPPSRALLGLIPMPPQHKKENEKSLTEKATAYYVSAPNFLRGSWKNYFLGYLLTFLYTWPKVFRKIGEVDPRIIVLNYPSAYTGLLGFSIGKLLGKKIVADFNDIIAEYTIHVLNDSMHYSRKKADGVFKSLVQQLLTTVQNYIIKHADLVTALTTYTVNYSQLHHIREGIHLIPDGVDVSLFNLQEHPKQKSEELKRRYGIKKDAKVVFYTGRLERWAGVEIVLQCAQKLKDSNTKFLLVGEGSLETDNRLLNVIFTGQIPHELIPEYLASADLVLVPMGQDTLGQSASPLKLFEAMAMEKPIIASDTIGIRDVIRDDVEGILLPQNADIWAETIANVLKNPAKLSELGRNARKKIETEFDWNFLANKFIKLLSEALKD
jgi:glycosyltransferase involved in cell wall biosynthesis